MRGVGAAVAGWLWLAPALALASAPPPDTQNQALLQAIQLYDNLEFDAAAQKLAQAAQSSTNPHDDVLIHTYQGIVEFQRNHKDAAAQDFKVALSLDLAAQLPADVSPKIRALWERVRLGLPKARPVDAPVDATPEPKVAPTPDARPDVKPAAKPDLTPTDGAKATEVPPSFFARHPVPTPAWVTLGAGGALALAGVGVGLLAHNSGLQAQQEPFQRDAAVDLARARNQQVLANVLLGAGLAGVIGFGALVMDSHAP
jgi:hypothetical protein